MAHVRTCISAGAVAIWPKPRIRLGAFSLSTHPPCIYPCTQYMLAARRRRPARLAFKATGPLAQTAAKEAQNVAQCVAQKEGY